MYTSLFIPNVAAEVMAVGNKESPFLALGTVALLPQSPSLAGSREEEGRAEERLGGERSGGKPLYLLRLDKDM